MKRLTISTLACLAIIAILAFLENMPVPDLMSPLVYAFEALFNLIK